MAPSGGSEVTPNFATTERRSQPYLVARTQHSEEAMRLLMFLILFEVLVTLCSGQDRSCVLCSRQGLEVVPLGGDGPGWVQRPYVRRNRYCEAFRRLPNPFYGGFCLLHGLGKREATRSKREYLRDALMRSINIRIKREAPPKGHGDSILFAKLRK